MYALRGLAVSFSIFAVLYCVLSVGVCCLWRSVWLGGRQYPARRCADLLFALRMIPFVVAAGITLVLAVPSFLLLEPRAVNEPMGAVPLALGACGMAVVLGGLWSATTALLRASRTVRLWSSDARVVSASSDDSVPVLRVSAAAPPLTAAGILRSSVWLSRAAEFVLTERELRSALRHEVVHIRRRDNLRKLILRLVAFPGMAELESAWREATEMAADDAAVSSASEALDLAAAVIKLSRLAPLEAAGRTDDGFGAQPGGVGECARGALDGLDGTAAKSGAGIYAGICPMRCCGDRGHSSPDLRRTAGWGSHGDRVAGAVELKF